MATGFSAADFSIAMTSSDLPMPIKDSDGFTTYVATLILPSRGQLNTLRGYLTSVDRIPALGGGGIIIRRWGTGARTLTFPVENGNEETASAFLVKCDARVQNHLSSLIMVDAEWLFAS